MAAQVVTRFAPSPTGFLHIGGARTALFNWLFARANGGKYLLRIEDTDRARSTDEAVTAILDGLDWLDLQADEDPIYQHRRADRHREIAQRMVGEGTAYNCYATPEELDVMREKAKIEGRRRVYDGTWRDREPGDAPEGVSPAIRLKAPRSGETVIEDAVQGRVVFGNENLDDLILVRSDGAPTYMLSVVVDDHDMGVTHVIRGDDHLTNAARQTLIFQALGWPLPTFAHVPLIHGPDGAKLSKRHGALGIEAYRAMGYLPAALRNYLVRLGWSHGDREMFSTDALIRLFGLEGIGRAPARLDFDKMLSVNSHTIRETDDVDLVDMLAAAFKNKWFEHIDPLPLDAAGRDRLKRAMPALKDRAKTLLDLIEKARFLFARRPISPDSKTAKFLTDSGREHLTNLLSILEDLPNWDQDEIDTSIRGYAKSENIGLGKVAQPLRAALTGTTASPGIFECLFALGRDESLARIRDQTTVKSR